MNNVSSFTKSTSNKLYLLSRKKNMKTECPVTSKSLGHIKQVFSNQISKQAPGLNELLG